MAQDPNQFAQTEEVGSLSALVNPAVISATVGSGGVSTGQAVKIVDAAGGPIQVVAAGQDDDIFGFVVRGFRTEAYLEGDQCEIALEGTVMYMIAEAAIAKGASVMPYSSGVKVVTAAVGSHRIIGRALDKAAADGDLIRVLIGRGAFALTAGS